MKPEFRVAAVRAAGCLDHVDVILRDAAGAEQVVRVDASRGRGVQAELALIPSDASGFVDLLAAGLRAHGLGISRIYVTPGRTPTGAVVIGNSRGEARGVRGLPAAVALLLATRLGLPVEILVEGPAEPVRDVPEAFRRALAELPLEPLGDGSQSPWPA